MGLVVPLLPGLHSCGLWEVVLLWSPSLGVGVGVGVCVCVGVSLCVCVWVCHCVSVCVCISCSVVSLCNPTNCSPPGFSVHGLLQARILEWVAIPVSRASSRPRD